MVGGGGGGGGGGGQKKKEKWFGVFKCQDIFFELNSDRL